MPVPAALACAAGTGIPLTHRDCARSVTFVTGHTRDGRLDIDALALARPGQTLAVYMGVVTLPALRDQLFAAGLDPTTPAAMIEAGGTDAQRLLRGTLAVLAARAPGWVSGAPALLLVGAAVGLDQSGGPVSRGGGGGSGGSTRPPSRNAESFLPSIS